MSAANTATEKARAKLEMIEACGRASQILGLPRLTGQIYGLLYFSTRPMDLDEIASELQISKASSSTGTRDLRALNAIREVWVQGDRRAHFEVEPELGELLRSAYNDLARPRITSSKKRLDRVTEALEEDLKEGRISKEEHKELAARLGKFLKLQKKFQTLIQLAEKVL